TTESAQESSGDNENAEAAAGDTGNDESSSAVANRAAGEMVSGVFVPVCNIVYSKSSRFDE
ncbi:unnamed protein product, partial [Rotaria socialis]